MHGRGPEDDFVQGPPKLRYATGQGAHKNRSQDIIADVTTVNKLP